MTTNTPQLATPPSDIPSDNVLLSALDNTLSPMTSSSQEDLPQLLDISFPPLPIDPDLTTSPLNSPPPSNPPQVSMETNPSETNNHSETLHITIDNTTPPPTHPTNPNLVKYDMNKDAHYTQSGIQPPVLHPFKNTSKLNILPPDYIELHPQFKSNLIALYLTPTPYKFRLPTNRADDHYVSYASRQLSQMTFWQSKRIRFFTLQFNFLKPTSFDLSTDISDPETLSLRSRDQHHKTYQTFLDMPSKQNFIYQNHKYTSPFNYHTHYRLDLKASTGHIRNYDAMKQYYIFCPTNDPTRPLIVPQEYLIVSDDSLLPSNIPTKVSTPFAPLESLLDSPLDDHSRSYYTSIVHHHYSYNELMFILAKLTQYILKKQYKYGTEAQQNKRPHLAPHTTVQCNSFDINPTLFTKEILKSLNPYINRNPTINPITILKNIFTAFESSAMLITKL